MNNRKMQKNIQKFHLKNNSGLNTDKEFFAIIEEFFDLFDANEIVNRYEEKAKLLTESILRRPLCPVPYAACKEIYEVYSILLKKIETIPVSEIVEVKNEVRSLSMVADLLLRYMSKVTETSNMSSENNTFIENISKMPIAHFFSNMDEKKLQTNLDTAYAYINTIKVHLSKAFEDDNIIEIVECISAGFGMQEMMLTYLF